MEAEIVEQYSIIMITRAFKLLEVRYRESFHNQICDAEKSFTKNKALN